MPEADVPIEIPDDGEGESKMPDIPDDRAGILLSESSEAHSSRMHETLSNAENAHAVARLAGVKKFDELDALESAATEVILKIDPNA